METVMTRQALLDVLEHPGKKTNAEWLSGLSARKKAEMEFHNQNRDPSRMDALPQDTYEQFYGNKKFYRTVAQSSAYVDGWIAEQARGKIFLDYACGNGINALKAARAGAALSIGLDISDVSVCNAAEAAQVQGLAENTRFVQGDCEQTGLPDQCVDAVLCSGMLHHLDLSYAFYELRRILKPGGVILAVEALDDNPLIKLYRARTPAMRTVWETAHILSYKDLVFASRFFQVKNIRHWHLFSILGAWMPAALSLFDAMDAAVLHAPFIRRMSWMFTFELHKAAG